MDKSNLLKMLNIIDSNSSKNYLVNLIKPEKDRKITSSTSLSKTTPIPTTFNKYAKPFDMSKDANHYKINVNLKRKNPKPQIISILNNSSDMIISTNLNKAK